MKESGDMRESPANQPESPPPGPAAEALNLQQTAQSNHMHPLLQMVWTRLKEFTRRPEAIFWVYVFPILMMLVLGSAFRSKPVEKIVVDIVEQPQVDLWSDNDPSSAGSDWQLAPENWREKLQQELAADERLKLRWLSQDECHRRLKSGKSELFLRVQLEPQLGIQYVFDPTRPGSVVARETVDDVLQQAAGRSPAVTVGSKEFIEPGGRYIDWLIPGLLGMGLMGGGLWGVGFAIVDMRIRKLLKTVSGHADATLGISWWPLCSAG